MSTATATATRLRWSYLRSHCRLPYRQEHNFRALETASVPDVAALLADQALYDQELDIRERKDAFEKSHIRAVSDLIREFRSWDKTALERWRGECAAHMRQYFQSNREQVRKRILGNNAQFTASPPPARPQLHFENVTDEDMHAALSTEAYGGTQISDKDRALVLQAFAGEQEEVSNRRPRIAMADRLTAAALFYQNSCAVTGHADATGHQTTASSVVEFCRAAGIRNAFDLFTAHWRKPGADSNLTAFKEELGDE